MSSGLCTSLPRKVFAEGEFCPGVFLVGYTDASCGPDLVSKQIFLCLSIIIPPAGKTLNFIQTCHLSSIPSNMAHKMFLVVSLLGLHTPLVNAQLCHITGKHTQGKPQTWQELHLKWNAISSELQVEANRYSIGLKAFVSCFLTINKHKPHCLILRTENMLQCSLAPLPYFRLESHLE